MTQLSLKNAINIQGRFQRSVQLKRDWQEQRSLRDYLLTPTARDLADQIMKGVTNENRSRAWSITGPYGSGKSAFALFITDLLTASSPKHPEAQILRSESDINKSLIPILTVGQRESLVPNLLKSVKESLVEADISIGSEIEEMLQCRTFSDREAVSMLDQAANKSKKAGLGGLLIVVDEFGKFLEYAAKHPDSEDLLFLQDLAELATRSEVPIVLITILHSAFAEYLSILDETRRSEWRKVQGRFTDVAFLEPPEQFLRLIGSAIEWDNQKEIAIKYSHEIENIVNSSAFEEAQRRFPLKELLPNCAPLHPVTTLLLWPLFRSKLAQNERSLFAFLMDRGPYGFQEFLSLMPLKENELNLFEIDRLYDYVVTALGPAIFLGNRSRRWAGIEHACNRVPANSPPLAEAIVKAVGLLNLYGAPVGLRASQSILEKSFKDADQIAETIKYLQKASIVIYRRYDATYALWEGSDVDLEAAYDEAMRHVGYGKQASRLKQMINLRPVVAKAHYVRKGTLRYFLADIVDGNKKSLKTIFAKEIHPADGQIVFVLTKNQQERNNLIKRVKELTTVPKLESKQNLILFAFPKQMVGLENALQEIEAWSWVLKNVPMLRGDSVAKKEVQTRIVHAQKQLQSIAGAVLGLSGYLFEPSASIWVQGGKKHLVESALHFQRWLSNLCDMVYHNAPELHNELINRENISSAATAGRRRLIEAMVESESECQLGITGTPSEYSMYRSLLETGGFHVEQNGTWHLTDPNEKWRPIWQAMKDFLANSTNTRRPVSNLISMLKAPPFGLREGPIPVILTALLLIYRDHVALYEEGLFVPSLRIEVLERLTKVPERFEIQQYRLDEASQDAFVAISEVLQTLKLTKEVGSTPDLLKIVKPLVIFAARLPDFAKKTRRIEPVEAIDVRDTLLQSRDPYSLIFKDLPEVLGVKIDNNRENIPHFANKLKDSLIALQQAYPRLLDSIEKHIRKTFSLDGTSIEAMQSLKKRARPLIGYASDRKLSLFVRQASRLGDRDWREVLAPTVTKGTPPSKWSDHDFVDFQVHISRVESDFVRLEELVAEKKRSGCSRILRIGVLDGQLEESREIISIPPDSQEQVDMLAEQIRDLINIDLSDVNARRIQLAALAKITQEYLKSQEEEIDD